MPSRRDFLRGTIAASTPTPNPSTSASLAPHDGAWTAAEARHLLRRTGFGAPSDRIEDVVAAGDAQTAVQQTVQNAADVPEPSRPDWFVNRRADSGKSSNYDVYRPTNLTDTSPLRHIWFERMRVDGLAGRMALFWHNFFPIEHDHPRIWAYHEFDYYYTLLEHAFGNFKTFVHAIGLTPAMMQYLDGAVNRASNPNENYARELLERFTMGPTGPDGTQNYTETDVLEVARALTGWEVTGDFHVELNPDRYDGGAKEILGQRGLFGYDNVIDIIFEERSQAVAHYVCRKLYCFFVRPLPDEAFISLLADELLAQNFEITPVLETLFSSAHFFDPAHRSARIKSPVELLVALCRDIGPDTVPDWIYEVMYREQIHKSSANLLRPPNVGGWPGYNPPEAEDIPGHYAWVTTDSLEQHHQWLQRLIPHFWESFWTPDQIDQLCTDPDDPFRVAVDIADAILPIPLDQFDPGGKAPDFTHDPTIPLPDWVLDSPPYVKTLGGILLDGLPFYNWPEVSDGDSDALRESEVLTRRFVVFLTQLPSYHLT